MTAFHEVGRKLAIIVTASFLWVDYVGRTPVTGALFLSASSLLLIDVDEKKVAIEHALRYRGCT